MSESRSTGSIVMIVTAIVCGMVACLGVGFGIGHGRCQARVETKQELLDKSQADLSECKEERTQECTSPEVRPSEIGGGVEEPIASAFSSGTRREEVSTSFEVDFSLGQEIRIPGTSYTVTLDDVSRESGTLTARLSVKSAGVDTVLDLVESADVPQRAGNLSFLAREITSTKTKLDVVLYSTP